MYMRYTRRQSKEYTYPGVCTNPVAYRASSPIHTHVHNVECVLLLLRMDICQGQMFEDFNVFFRHLYFICHLSSFSADDEPDELYELA